MHQKKIEELDQVSCQQKLDLQINKETWEKFHILKKSQDKKQGQVVSYTELLRDNKYVIYLAGAAQMVQVDQHKSIYVGGLGINYKNILPNFRLVPGLETEINETELIVGTITVKKPWKRELQMKLGRFGHLACWSEDDYSIYIFGGQQ